LQSLCRNHGGLTPPLLCTCVHASQKSRSLASALTDRHGGLTPPALVRARYKRVRTWASSHLSCDSRPARGASVHRFARACGARRGRRGWSSAPGGCQSTASCVRCPRRYLPTRRQPRTAPEALSAPAGIRAGLPARNAFLVIRCERGRAERYAAGLRRTRSGPYCRRCAAGGDVSVP